MTRVGDYPNAGIDFCRVLPNRGGQVGCDLQFAPNWVIGIQGSGSGANIKGDVLDTFWQQVGPYNKTFHARTDWLADVTGRVGVVWDRFMVYAKGGVAWAGDKYNVTEDFTCGACTFPAPPETRAGFVAGVGVEWAFWANLSAFVEWDFYGFGTRAVAFNQLCRSTGCVPFPPGHADVKQDINVVKAGLNWRFNFGKAPAPVVARY